MILNNVIAIGDNEPVSIHINGSKITRCDQDRAKGEIQLNFTDAIIFPGLINSHDHLDFNLFPQLGSNIYDNYTEWGNHIHQNYKEEIAAVLKVPQPLRVQWGLYKNLLSGVTTVVNHGAELKLDNPLINVLQTHNLHSVQFEKLWKVKLNNPLKRKALVVAHTGEGCDTLACREIDKLIRWNLWRKKLIGVHGVAMSTTQAKKFEALVWCPESNYFLLNKTARIAQLKNYTPILFGTDSTLTGNWNIWDHLRLARKTQQLTDDELYGSVNKYACAIWKMNDQETDLVIAKRENGANYLDAFFSVDPKDILLVLHNGNMRLFDAELLGQMEGLELKNFSKITINGIAKYVEGNLPQLMQKIEAYYPDADFPIRISETK